MAFYIYKHWSCAISNSNTTAVQSFRSRPGKEGKGAGMAWVVLGTLWMGSKGEEKKSLN